MALRQYIWERDGEFSLEIEHDKGDYPRWIDTSCMIADPLTKNMAPDVLVNAMTTGVMDLRPTEESIMIKERNRVARKEAKERQKAEKEDA